MIPFVDLRQQHEALLPELLARVEVVLASGTFVGGAELEAFEREFATMASLSVPGVAQVFDFGVISDASGEGRTFYTRAYVEGRPLDQ